MREVALRDQATRAVLLWAKLYVKMHSRGAWIFSLGPRHAWSFTFTKGYVTFRS